MVPSCTRTITSVLGSFIDNGGSFVDIDEVTAEVEAVRFAIPPPYLQQIVLQVAACGVDVGQWLAPAGLSAGSLEQLAQDFPLPLFERLLREALELTREPALGLLVGQSLQLQTHGYLGYAALSSGSLRQALGLFGAFTRARLSLLDVVVEERGEAVRVRMVERWPLGAAQRPVLEAVAMAVKNILEAITMGSSPIDLVSFSFPAPSYADFAGQLFGCRVRYGSRWAGFTLPNRGLDKPLRAADPLAFREAVNICERELARLATTESFAGRVRRLLLEQPNGFPSLPVCARLLQVTPRTLHRRLLDEGTSFREILEELRSQLARDYLQLGRLSFQEIAYRLGYRDIANFRRAFKRWEGEPPVVVRTKLARR